MTRDPLRSAGRQEMRTFGLFLRQRREAAGVTRERLVDICARQRPAGEEINDDWYGRIERGQRSRLSGWELRVLLAAFREITAGLTFAELLTAAGYVEDYQGSSPVQSDDPKGTHAETVAA